jgi:CHASE2 domain-containing sensor protein
VSLDLAKARRSLAVMLVVTGLAMLAAFGFAWGHFAQGVEWMRVAFVAAIAVGVGAQIWFIAAVVRANKGA